MSALPPRAAPLEVADWDSATKDALARWMPPMNFHKTMAHNSATLRGWIGFGNHILFENLLSRREREIVILRIAATLGCAYEWGAHRRFTLAEDLMTAEEADRLASPLAPDHWDVREAALVAATDDLLVDRRIGDAAWEALAGHGFTPAHFIDLIYLAGEFIMVAMFLDSFRVPLEDGFVAIPGRQ